VTNPSTAGKKFAGAVRPGCGGAGGLGSSFRAVGAVPTVYGPAAAVLSARNPGPLRWPVSPNSHSASVAEYATLCPPSRPIGLAAVSAVDRTRPMSTVAVVLADAVRKFCVALKSAGSG
jgi:hypothetical protein